MEKEELLEYKKKLQQLSYEENIKRDLYLRNVALGNIYGPTTGYPSIDKPWLKYYKEEYIKATVPHMTITEYLEKLNKNHLNNIALNGLDGKYTYKELINTYNKAAKAILNLGMNKGDISLFVLPPLAIEPILFYMASKSGTIVTGLPPQVTLDEIIKGINKFNAKTLFGFEELLSPDMEKEIYEKTNVKNIIIFSFKKLNDRCKNTMSWQDFIKSGENLESINITTTPEDIVFISQTGGSTGEPKSVMINSNHLNIGAYELMNSDLNYKRNDKWLRLWALFSASAALSNSHLPLCIGTEMIIRPFPININDFDKLIINTRANHLVLIPQLLDVLENSTLLKNQDLSFIKTAGCGGLSITEEFENRIKTFFENHNIDTFLGYAWGCTENTLAAAMRSNTETTRFGTVGAPLVKTTVTTFNPDTLEENTFGKQGELCINSPTIMAGYYNDLESTKNVIKRHSDGSYWLHTGDLGNIDANGIVTVNGRITRTIFAYPTAKVYPSILENTLAQVDGIMEIAICKMEDVEHPGFYVPVCFAVPKPNYNPDLVKENIINYCTNYLSEEKRPKKIIIKDFLPLTKVGKPDILELEKELQKQLVLNKKLKI